MDLVAELIKLLIIRILANYMRILNKFEKWVLVSVQLTNRIQVICLYFKN